jgi:hypothetical protein
VKANGKCKNHGESGTRVDVCLELSLGRRSQSDEHP